MGGFSLHISLFETYNDNKVKMKDFFSTSDTLNALEIHESGGVDAGLHF